MAGNTSQSSFAPLKTTAPVHLLGVVGDGAVGVDLGRANKHGQNPVQGHTGPKIKELPIPPHDAALAMEMTLLANPFPQGRRQVAWIDDGIVRALNPVAVLAELDVQLAGTVTPLTTDGQVQQVRRVRNPSYCFSLFLEDRAAVAVGRVRC